MTEVKGVIKTPNHYKHVNVVVDNLPENQHPTVTSFETWIKQNTGSVEKFILQNSKIKEGNEGSSCRS